MSRTRRAWHRMATRAAGRSLQAAKRSLRAAGAAAAVARGPLQRFLRRHRRVRVALEVATRTVAEVFKDRLLRLAAEVAFWSLLSLPPLLLGLLGAVGYLAGLAGPHTVDQIRHSVLNAAGAVTTPSTVRNVIAPLVDQVLGSGHPDVVSTGFFISFWSGSAAMNGYVGAVTVAYDMDGLRPGWRTRVLAVGLYTGALLVGAVLLPALALGPGVIVSLVPGVATPAVSAFVHVVYWPVVGAVSLALLASLYKLAVPIRFAPWVRGLPGAAVAVAVWLAGSFGLRAYLTSGLHHTASYGTLAAPVAALLFFYVTALAVLVGAELNSEIDSRWPHPRTVRARELARHLGRRSPPPDGVAPGAPG